MRPTTSEMHRHTFRPGARACRCAHAPTSYTTLLLRCGARPRSRDTTWESLPFWTPAQTYRSQTCHEQDPHWLLTWVSLRHRGCSTASQGPPLRQAEPCIPDTTAGLPTPLSRLGDRLPPKLEAPAHVKCPPLSLHVPKSHSFSGPLITHLLPPEFPCSTCHVYRRVQHTAHLRTCPNGFLCLVTCWVAATYTG